MTRVKKAYIKDGVFAFSVCVVLLCPAARADEPPMAPVDGKPSMVPGDGQSLDLLSKPAAWRRPDRDEVQAQAFAWLEASGANEAARDKAMEIWSSLPGRPTGAQLLTALAETLALTDQDVAELVRLCSEPKRQLVLASRPWLTDPNTPPLVANNMRLLYGRWLVHEALFDEAREQLATLKPDDVVAPAVLLFYQGVTCHTLLDKEAGLKTIGQLLEGAEQAPRRYVALAELIERDLKGLEDDSLDHIARRMDDIRRRLDLGRAGPKVRGIEDGVIESLDKLIKKLEEQQQQSQGSGSNNIQSNNPASDSRIIGGKGRGNVTQRDIGSDSGWGNLPPKQREEALQAIGRDFPAHYRDVIEQYFRRLATEGNP